MESISAARRTYGEVHRLPAVVAARVRCSRGIADQAIAKLAPWTADKARRARVS